MPNLVRLLRPLRFTKHFLAARGLSISRSENTLSAKRLHLMDICGINLVVDVGANIGQFVREIRTGGYRDEIISFEPLSRPFLELERLAGADPALRVQQLAIGESTCNLRMVESSFNPSSSLREFTELGKATCPDASEHSHENVSVVPLDAALGAIELSGKRVFLKIDTQGYEREVLMGATQTLQAVRMLQVEFSVELLYAGQALVSELWKLIESRGFRAYWIEPGFAHPETGTLLQFDVLFMRGDTTTRDR